jgi:hypothetical protein
MSATNFTPIQIYYSTTAAAVPVNTNLLNGELAINITDGKLYYKNNSGTVTLLASSAGASGDVVGPASATDNALARFDLTTGKLIQNSVGILSDAGALTGLTGLTSTSITDSGLTSGRVTYAGTGGLLQDSANLLWDGTNLGIAATLATWTNTKGIQIGPNAAVFAQDNNTGAYIASNTYYNTGWKYIGTGYATKYEQSESNNGSHKWYIAPSGTAGGAITFTQAMTLDTSGRLLIGTTTASGANYLQVNSDASIYGLTVGRGAGAVATNTAVGASVLSANTGANNSAFGNGTLNSNTSGADNTGLGRATLATNTAGQNNTASGSLSMFLNTTGNFNTAYGANSLYSNTTASNNTAVGYQAAYSGTTATNSVAIGANSLYSNTTGNNNTALGANALYTNTAGVNNVAVGMQSMKFAGGSYSIGIGVSALLNDAGSNNVGVGYQTLSSASMSGSNNVAVGYQSAYANTTGTRVAGLGYQSLYSNTTGYNNTATGWKSLYTNTTGYENTATGLQALYSNTTGIDNVAFGQDALFSNTTASNNTAVGFQALYSNQTGSSLTAVGVQAGYTTASAAPADYFGKGAGYSNQTGASVCYIGFQSGYSATGAKNTFVGANSGSDITTGYNNTILGRYIGNAGGLDIRTASNYIVLSDGDGNPRGIFDGSGYFYLGTTSAIASTSSRMHILNVNAGLGGLTIGNSGGSTGTYCAQFANSNGVVGNILTVSGVTQFNTSSDYRLKDITGAVTGAKDFIMALKPKQGTWKADGEKFVGFLAHEFQEVSPISVHGVKDAVDEDGKPIYQSMQASSSEVMANLISFVQELQAEIDALKSQLNQGA